MCAISIAQKMLSPQHVSVALVFLKSFNACSHVPFRSFRFFDYIPVFQTRAHRTAIGDCWQARGRYRATQMIIHGFNRLMSARRARQFLRRALATAHRVAAEELLHAG